MPNLAPKPPPMNSVTTRTRDFGSSNTSASSSRTDAVPWVDE
jgi:hypothetical protein